MKKLIFFIIFITLSYLTPRPVFATAISWDGGGDASSWSDGNNWSGDSIPTDADDVTIDVDSASVDLASTTTINSLVLGNSGGTNTVILNFSYDAIASGALIIDAGSFTAYSGASVTHSIGSYPTVRSVFIDVQTGSALINGSINASIKGFLPNTGLGTGEIGENDGGAGHGGTGGRGYYRNYSGAGGDAYGSITNPVTLGSGGGQHSGTAGTGGGAIKLNAVTEINVAGSIQADGGNSVSCWSGGGGSGGSIQIHTALLSGSGSITVDGGDGCNSGSGQGGGGGAGRIALYYDSKTHNGTLTAYGGTTGAHGYGGAGTIYEKEGAANGDLLIDNNDQFTSDNYSLGNTPLTTDTFDTITLQNYGQILTDSSTNITYTTLDWSTKGSVVDNGGTFPLYDSDLTIPSTAYLYSNFARTISNLVVTGTLTHSGHGASATNRTNLTVSGDMTVTGSIDVSYIGYQETSGTGVGGSMSGGGHGGIGGGDNGGSAYDSMYEPILLGSGGGRDGSDGKAGAGGGAVQLTVGGTFTNNGTISAIGQNGVSWDAGGGSGGSFYLLTGSFAGTGPISVNGGDGCGASGKGGAGGRTAIYYSDTNSYSGSITVAGGNDAEQGTKLIKATGGELLSSPFDTGDPATFIHQLAWTENLDTGTDAKFQLRTAPDSSGSPGTWTDWLGPSGAGTYYTDPAGGESISSTHSDTSEDQWIQYKVIMSAELYSTNIPTISDFTITYVINTSPTVTITNTPSESSTGTVTTTFTVSDSEESAMTAYLTTDIGITISSDFTQGNTGDLTVSDTSNLPSASTILIDSEMITYTGKSGNSLTGITRGTNTTSDTTHTSSSSVWLVASASALTGDYGSINTTGTKTIIWTPTTDLTNLETSTGKIKVFVNDGNLANQVGFDSVNSVTLDTKAPTSTDIFIDKYTGKITLQATDAHTISYKASNQSNLSADGVNASSGDWISYSTPISWTFSGDPSTVYLASKDQYNNISSTVSTISPTRLSSLVIQDASNPDTSEWRLFISWVVATTPANGFDYYQIYRSTDGSAYSAYQQINSISENYLLDDELNSSTTYYYKTTIIDDHGNESDANYPIQVSGSSSRSGIGLTPDGSGGGDFTGPVISSIATNNLTSTGVTFTWTTDELADSKIGYSLDTSYASEVGSITMTTSHTLTLSNLTPATKYYYRTMSYDALNNKTTTEDSSTYYFTTLADTTGPTLSNIKSVVGQTSAGISWSTSESASSLVEYSTDTSYSESNSSATLVQGHALAITGLTNSTTYNYRITSTDSSDNSTVSSGHTFTTSSVTASDTTAPTISSVTVSDITATSARVSWNTGEDADGKAEYGESTSYERGIAEGNHDYETSKVVTLIGLSPETTYHYRVIVVDAAGNTNASGDATFTTSAQSTIDLLSDAGESSGSNAPSITSDAPAVTDITGTAVKVNWETNKKATSEVYYKIKNSLDAPSNSGATTYIVSHSVDLTNLTPATTYEYQVKSVDVNGNYVTSSKYEFTTTLPGVASVRVTSKSESTATVEWITVTPTSTVVEYTSGETRETKLYSNSSLVNSHIANLTGLSPSTAYLFEVLVSDEAGNLARSDQYSFVTDIDTEGPIISAVNNRSTIVAGQNKVQTVITWVTNEPTTSQVNYSLGSGVGDYSQSTNENTDFVNNHIIVIASLKPGSVYRYRVVSRDRADNIVESDPFVLLTPIKEVSALDLIIQNLEGAFGWLNNIRR